MESITKRETLSSQFSDLYLESICKAYKIYKVYKVEHCQAKTIFSPIIEIKQSTGFQMTGRLKNK